MSVGLLKNDYSGKKATRKGSVHQNARKAAKKLPLKEKLRRFFGFGPDLNLLAIANMWLALMYFLTGLCLFIFHIMTNDIAYSTLNVTCAENSCWTTRRETNIYSHKYNIIQNTDYYYDTTHFGIWFGVLLALYALLTGFRLTRFIINFGYLLHITFGVTCLTCFPLVLLEVLAWLFRHKMYVGVGGDCHILQIRACNDLFLLAIVFGMVVIQLVINRPYLQRRSIRLIGPILTQLTTHQKATRHWLENQPFYHSIKL